MRGDGHQRGGGRLLSLVRQSWGTLMMMGMGVCCVGVGESSTKLLKLKLAEVKAGLISDLEENNIQDVGQTQLVVCVIRKTKDYQPSTDPPSSFESLQSEVCVRRLLCSTNWLCQVWGFI